MNSVPNSVVEVAVKPPPLPMGHKNIKTSPSMVPGKAPTLARAVTLAQVAEFVGVSQSAVSVVLNNSRSKVRVSQATRQRILDAARELNYQPNALTRSVQRRRTNVIGFYSDREYFFDPSFPFFGQLLKGLMKGCDDHEKNFLIHGAFCRRSEDDIYQELLNGQIDGLVLYAREPSPLVERLVESRLPVVTVADEVPGLPCVTVNEEQGGRLLAQHLKARGYSKALFCVTDRILPSTIEERLAALQSEGQSLGLSVERHHWLHMEEDGYDAQRELKKALDKSPDVLAAFNDFTADHIVNACWDAGMKLPEDVAVTGFDGFVSLYRPAPHLTTVRAQWDEVARRAVSLLVEQCNGQPVPLHTYLPVEFVSGQTA